ncbi:MAG: lamin tail domain-containing protein, partial [Planctomycetes bacterium]|nr:lamin tail domain-containing protein [Planctomycetota bacterium]
MRIRPFAVAALVALTPPARPSDFDVVIHEIHYNPLSGDDRDEFIELYNRGPAAVDLGGWSFTEGISMTFAAGTVLEPKGFLVVSPDPPHAIARYGLQRALGPYTSRLDNDGEILALSNARSEVMSRVHYDDEGTWPSRCDGLGPSLELLDPHAVPDVGRAWASSVSVDGTPGAPSSRAGAGGSTRVLAAAQDNWRYFKGTQEASNPRTAWTTLGFSDASWPAAPGGFGYGNQPFETELADMQGSYTTVYIRSRFTLTAADLAGIAAGDLSLSLAVRYDDACVAYVNGTEVGRANAANAGAPPPFDATADAGGGGQALFNLDPFVGALGAGQNAVAVHGLNNTRSSSDFLIEAELSIAVRPPSTRETRSQVVVNELKPTEEGSPGFLELYNRGGTAFPLGSHAVLNAAGHRFDIPGATQVPARGRVTFTDAQLGFSTALVAGAYVLVRRDGATGEDHFVDALDPRVPPAGSSGLSFGPVPDGGDDLYLMTAPSPGAANAVQLTADVVVNEIYFHPPYVAPGGGCTAKCSDLRQWIELHNRGASPVNVAGWSLSKGVELLIPSSPAVSIPAGGHLVLASSRATFLAEHPGFDPAKVLGDWRKDLAHDSDTINLNDALGNRADHVKYGDGGPLNDVEPEDGTDDETFRGSAWPATADGTSRTLELIHPRLDNRDGAAWAAGPPGGTPGAANVSFAAAPAPVIGKVEHSPAVPRPGQAVTVRCRVSAASAVSTVDVLWHREGGGASGTVALKDDGLSGDGAAGDGEHGGQIPAQPDRAVVGFQVRARLAAGGTPAVVPRAPPVPPYPGFAGPFFLYQTLAASLPVNPSESYYVVMAATDLSELGTRPVESNELLPCTFVHVARDGDAKVRHLSGIRYRGTQVRSSERKSYRIDLPSEDRFEDIEHLNLNSSDIEHELLASDLFRRAGMPYPQEWSVNLTFQGTLDPRYVRKEHMDEDFLERFFGDASDSGNFYRALDPNDDPRAGDLTYYGEDPADYAPYYQKRSNEEEADYSDVIELCRAFDRTQTPDELFPDVIEALVDVNEWARYLALQGLLSNPDGSIQTASGEDYFLYRVPFTSRRPDAGKWLLVPWDIEESFRDAGERLFRPQLPSVRRFLTHPRFAPLYYESLVSLRHGAFNRFETRQRFVLIDFLFGFGTIDGLDTFITNRIGFIDSNVPVELSAGVSSLATSVRLVQVGDPWRYWKGTQAPPGATLAWTQRGYDDQAFLVGPTGIGYGDGDDATVLGDMEDNYTTVYARRVFTVADPALVGSLALEIDFDDGFVAYLNGVEVARRNAPGNAGGAVAPDATATDGREAGTPEMIDLGAFIGRLVAGNNVLAIQALNQDPGSSDLSLIPELMTGAGASGGLGCGTVLYATSDSIGLEGRANAYLTGSIKVAGALASYDPFRAVWSAAVSLGPGDNQVLVQAFASPDGTGTPFETLTLTVKRLARAPTQVSGTLSGTTRWTETDGPYLMTADVTIPAGSRLLIDPGTLVIGQSGASIIVRGEIQALGTAQKPILFRALSCANRWGGIAIDGTGTAAGSVTHTLRYCDLEFGDNPSGFAGCVAPVGSKLLVDGCSFRFLTANAVDGTDARVEVRGSLFEKINEGVHCTSSTVIILDSTFRGMVGDKDAIDFDLNGTERSRIERCLIEDGSDDGIDLQETTVDIRDNVIRNVADKALSLEMDGPLGPPTVTGNLIYDSGTGMSLKSGIRITEAHHNTLVGNQEGINLYAKAGASDGGHGTFHSMIVWNNIADVKLDALSTAGFTYSDISSGVFPGIRNISSDPKFVSVGAEDYALRPSSP